MHLIINFLSYYMLKAMMWVGISFPKIDSVSLSETAKWAEELHGGSTLPLLFLITLSS